jgi:ubiquinone biosynthesis protein
MGILALLRLARAGFTLSREGALALVDRELLPPSAAAAVGIGRLFERRGLEAEDRGERISRALNRLGPSYIKLGQFLATRADIVGAEAAEAFGKLRDEIAPFPEEEARRTVEASLGKPLAALFASFSPAVAAASIAQVHKATVVTDGETREVAVKVIRPGVRLRFRRDLETFYAAAGLAERLDRRTIRLRPVASVDTLARSVTLEMDLRLEAAAISEMHDTTRGEPGFRVPAVDWERTSRDVLTMEWIDGIKMSRTAELVAAGYGLTDLAVRLMRVFLRQALRDGFFHADMHQGNLFVDKRGDIVAVDLGIVGRIDLAQRRFLAEVLYGFIRRDYRRIAEVHIAAGYVPERHLVEEFAQALRAIGEPIHNRPARDISMARLLGLLFEVTELFDMATRPELLMLQKTMVVVEGVCRSLDPDFDMWSTAEPVVREWMERHLGVVGRLEDLSNTAAALSRFVNQLPALAEKTEKLVVEFNRLQGIKLDPETVAAIGQAEARASRWGRYALWVIALCLGLLVVILR